MTTFERIDNLVRAKGISANKMMKELGFSNSVYYQWKRGLQNPSAEKTKAIASYLGCPHEYLLGLTTNDKLVYVETVPPKGKSTVEIIDNDTVRIPIYESVSAGLGVYADDKIVGFTHVTVKKSDVNNVFAAKVVGDSMYPYINDGDTLIIRKTDLVDSGDIAVVLIDGEEAVVKKVKFTKGQFTLSSFNPTYPDRVFSAEECEERIRIVGKVISSSKNWE